jgi:hypothetical protein
MMSAIHSLESRVQRFPIRGGIYGLMIGLSAAIYLVLFAVTPFRIQTLIVIAVAGLLVGALWGSVAPARKSDGVPPSTSAFGSTFTRSEDFEGGPPPSYEDAFGTPAPERDDGSFGTGDQPPEGSDPA